MNFILSNVGFLSDHNSPVDGVIAKKLLIDFSVDIKPSSVHGNAFLSFDDKKDAIKVRFFARVLPYYLVCLRAKSRFGI